jgi:hypothetical protein
MRIQDPDPDLNQDPDPLVRHGSADPDPNPDPHQNGMNPQHWFQLQGTIQGVSLCFPTSHMLQLKTPLDPRANFYS